MSADQVLIGRQPIYDSKMKVFAYELLYRSVDRSADRSKANVVDGNQATSQVLLNAFVEIGIDRLTDSKPAFVNFTREFLLNRDLVLPKERVVLEVLEDIDIDESIVQAVIFLAKSGHKIALDDFAFEPKWLPLLMQADYVKVEMSALREGTADQSMHRLRAMRLKAKLLAEKVETLEDYDYCRKKGFDLFQGYYFSKPQVIEGRSIQPNQAAVLRILAEVNSPSVQVDALDRLIRTDPSLSFKLLKYLNSPYFALRNRVDSIRQAVTYLGLSPLRTWITLLVMAGIRNKPAELCKIALQRARQCESISKLVGGTDTERSFMVGLLSLLDAMMDLPMTHIVKELPLSSDVESALLLRQGPLGIILDMVVKAEAGQWDQVVQWTTERQIDLSKILLDGIMWADRTMNELAKA